MSCYVDACIWFLQVPLSSIRGTILHIIAQKVTTFQKYQVKTGDLYYAKVCTNNTCLQQREMNVTPRWYLDVIFVLKSLKCQPQVYCMATSATVWVKPELQVASEDQRGLGFSLAREYYRRSHVRPRRRGLLWRPTGRPTKSSRTGLHLWLTTSTKEQF